MKMKWLIMMTLTTVLFMGCDSDEEDDLLTTSIKKIPGTYYGQMMFTNGTGWIGSDNITIDVSLAGGDLMINFYQSDMVGNMTFRGTALDLGYADAMLTDVVFKIEKQVVGEKIKNTYEGLPLGVQGAPPTHHGYVQLNITQNTATLMFFTEQTSDNGDKLNFSVNALKESL